VCRPVAGPCDVAEQCSGSADACPADAVVPSTTQVCAPWACNFTTKQCVAAPCANDGDCAVGSFCTNATCVTGKRLFVTSTLHSGNLGGLAGADAICQARAQARNITGTFKAWLSTDTAEARTRLNAAPAVFYTRKNFGVVARVANSFADLTSGTRAMVIDANDLEGTSFTSVWTGTEPSGAAAGDQCSGWTSAASGALGRFGRSNPTTTTDWTSEGSGTCSLFRALYCVEQ
jgi:hypothetical protein